MTEEPNYDSAEARFWEDKMDRASENWRAMSNLAADLGWKAREAGPDSPESAAYWALRRASQAALDARDKVADLYGEAIWADAEEAE